MSFSSFTPASSQQFLFGRAYSLLLGPAGAATVKQYANYTFKGQTPSPLRVRFDINRILAGTAGKSKIELFNMSGLSRSSLAAGWYVQLNAGYNGLVDLVFKGNIATNGISSKRHGPDIITSMDCYDGGSSLLLSKISSSYPPGTTLMAVLNDILKMMAQTSLSQPLAINKGAFVNIPNLIYQRGLGLDCSCQDALDKLLKPQGLQWNVQNGALYINLINSFNQQSAIDVNAQTGLIGIPSKNSAWVDFVSLLNPRIVPGALVKLTSAESPEVNGNYTIFSAHYEGDTHDNKWQVSCRAQSIATAPGNSAGSSLISAAGIA